MKHKSPYLGHNADTFMTTGGFSSIAPATFTLLCSRVLLLMIKSLRPLLLASFLLPLALSVTAAPIN
ncbi:hypothetical protein GIW58_10400, partial [Pseudomonas gessardii]|nr:hypothetical protein [Pseudomonas gessardii]